jgi:hypothetical protein
VHSLNEWGKCRLIFLFYSDVIAGMDASQMEESLSERQWEGEADYHPASKGFMRLD